MISKEEADQGNDSAMENPPPSSTSTSSSPPKANSAIPNPSASSKPKKRLRFAEDVVSSGDGSKVIIKEEHGVFLGPLLGRMVVSDISNSDQSDDDNNTTTNNNNKEKAKTKSESSIISFANDEHTNEKLSYSESSNGILKSEKKHNGVQPFGDTNIEYDNLVVRLGLLKCGHRYQVVIPVPNYWEQKDASNEQIVNHNDTKLQSSHVETNLMKVRMAEDSLDDDLRGEVLQTEEDSGSCEQHVCITLSARRRGLYRGRFLLELTRIEQQKKTESIPKTSEDESTTTKLSASSNPATVLSTPNKVCLMSIQCDATIMGKDMGTPKLRNGVVCLGKIVGYDSDDETEWQGFD